MPEKKTHPLIENLTAPLADNAEQRLRLNETLEAHFDPTHPTVPEATAQLDRADQRKFPRIRQLALWLIALGVLLVPYQGTLKMSADIISEIDADIELNIFDSDFDLDIYAALIEDEPELPEHLSDEERLLLYDPEMDALEQAEKLHLSQPDNPAYYAVYVNRLITSEEDGLPPDYFQVVERIAPNNSFFYYLAAAERGKSAIEKKYTKRAPKKPRFVDGVRMLSISDRHEYTIKNESAYQEALLLLNQADKMPKFETYSKELYLTVYRFLPKDTIKEWIFSYHSLIFDYVSLSQTHHLRSVTDLMNARAHELSQKGDKNKFLELVEFKDGFTRKLSQNSDVYFGNMDLPWFFSELLAVNFHTAAERLEMHEFVTVFQEQKNRLQEHKDTKRIRMNKESGFMPSKKASYIANTTLSILYYQTLSPPPLTEETLAPLRFAEHDLAGRIGLAAVAFLLFPAALVLWLSSCLLPRPLRRTASRFTQLLQTRDWVWVCLLGVVVPVLAFAILTRVSPVSGRDVNFMHFNFLFPGLHLLTLFFVLLILPPCVLKWRLSVRLAPFDFAGRETWTKWLPSIAIDLLLIAALGAYPLVEEFGLGTWTRNLLAIPFALCLALIVGNAWQLTFGHSTQRFVRAAAVRAALPIYAVAVLAICAIIPIHIASEKHWVSQDTLFRIDPDAPDLGAYEFKVAAQMRKELHEVLGFDPDSP